MACKRNIVFFVNCPNSDDFFLEKDNAQSVAKGVQHTDWANFPHLGILSLASYIEKAGYEAVYFDGVALPLSELIHYLKEHHERTLAICLSAITANFETCLYVSDTVKSIDTNIKTVFGNDHFSVMHDKIITRYKSIDYGIIGNEVYHTLKALLRKLKSNQDADIKLPLLITKHNRSTDFQKEESINQHINYSLIDKHFQHNRIYNKNFQYRLGNRIYNLTKRHVKSGVPVEIARGCIKFNGNDACSFCSIQYGGIWRNFLDHKQAWEVIKAAHDSGYDYLYVTADELPLTFGRLLLNMDKYKPKWWVDLHENERPILVGYARADGMKKSHIMKSMSNIGFKILFIGIDAGSIKSLQALNKPLKSHNVIASSENMHEANMNAINNARKYNIKIKAGFVLGHIGMNDDLLTENIREYKNLLEIGRDVIVSADIEMLSPEPGSKDYEYLINPELAKKTAATLGLEIGSDPDLNKVAKFYNKKDIFNREKAINDYIQVMMPSLTTQKISHARNEIRAFSKRLGIVIGDEL
jgi:anaerobic magnesium-protoporphyrin IX monomethyl ester cyclase